MASIHEPTEPSLYIPYLNEYVTKEQLCKNLKGLNYGVVDVDCIDFIHKKTQAGRPFSRAFIHFKEWTNTPEATRVRDAILKGEEVELNIDNKTIVKMKQNKLPRPSKHETAEAQPITETKRRFNSIKDMMKIIQDQQHIINTMLLESVYSESGKSNTEKIIQDIIAKQFEFIGTLQCSKQAKENVREKPAQKPVRKLVQKPRVKFQKPIQKPPSPPLPTQPKLSVTIPTTPPYGFTMAPTTPPYIPAAAAAKAEKPPSPPLPDSFKEHSFEPMTPPS